MSNALAVLATVPGREVALAQCLQSLRPQVDEIRVVCHDMVEPPTAVRAYADDWLCEPDTRGSAAKLHWAGTWTGLYLGCDDDFRYPTDYVETMRRWVRRWKGRALVTCHGRILKPRSTGFTDVVQFWPPQGANPGGWVNYPGGCAMAFDTRLNVPSQVLNVPSQVPGKNLEEVHLAVWAQQNKVPLWLVPHREGWLQYLLPEKGVTTIWTGEKKIGFANRNAVIVPQTERAPWVLHTC